MCLRQSRGYPTCSRDVRGARSGRRKQPLAQFSSATPLVRVFSRSRGVSVRRRKRQPVSPSLPLSLLARDLGINMTRRPSQSNPVLSSTACIHLHQPLPCRVPHRQSAEWRPKESARSSHTPDTNLHTHGSCVGPSRVMHACTYIHSAYTASPGGPPWLSLAVAPRQPTHELRGSLPLPSGREGATAMQVISWTNGICRRRCTGVCRPSISQAWTLLAGGLAGPYKVVVHGLHPPKRRCPNDDDKADVEASSWSEAARRKEDMTIWGGGLNAPPRAPLIDHIEHIVNRDWIILTDNSAVLHHAARANGCAYELRVRTPTPYRVPPLHLKPRR